MDIPIQKILDKSSQEEPLSREEIITLLSLDSATEVVESLYKAGREAARRYSNNQGRIWAAIGVDYQPCPVNCRFCSFGEAWGIIKSRRELPPEQIETQAIEFADQGARWITLRTTEDYSIDRLADFCRRVIRATQGRMEIVANTGELMIFQAG